MQAWMLPHVALLVSTEQAHSSLLTNQALQSTGDAVVTVCSCSLRAAASASAFLRRARTSSVKASFADPLSPAGPWHRRRSLREGCLAVNAPSARQHGLPCNRWLCIVRYAGQNWLFRSYESGINCRFARHIAVRGQANR